MTGPLTPDSLLGRTAYDSGGDKIGKIEQVYLDDTNEEPVWLTVSGGLFGRRHDFAPVRGATLDGNDVRLGVTKDVIKGAPEIDGDRHIDDAAVAALSDYYAGSGGAEATQQHTADPAVDRAAEAPQQPTAGPAPDRTTEAPEDDPFAPMPKAEPAQTEPVDAADEDPFAPVSAPEPQPAREPTPEPVPQPTPEPVPDAAPEPAAAPPADDGAMTRSEQRLNVDTERVETGRARLRRYVVTEDVQVTVPVSREEVRVERTPIADGDAAGAAPAQELSEAEHEVVLHEERPVVTTETVPVEQVRLTTETVSSEQEVSAPVSKEQIDVETDDDPADKDPFPS